MNEKGFIHNSTERFQDYSAPSLEKLSRPGKPIYIMVSNGFTPENVCNVFTRPRQIHSYNTRSASAGNFYVATFGTVRWNSLSATTRKRSRKQFKGKIHNVLLKIFAADDNFIELATLLQRTRGL